MMYVSKINIAWLSPDQTPKIFLPFYYFTSHIYSQSQIITSKPVFIQGDFFNWASPEVLAGM